MQVGVITNPNSKKNYRRPQRRRSLEQAVGRHGLVRETQSLDELNVVVAELLDAGCKYWVCDGGDGTLHWVLNSLYSAVQARTSGDEPLDIPVIVPTNGGTVDFVARKAGLKGDADSIVRRLVSRLDSGAPISTIRVDTCRAVGQPVRAAGADQQPRTFDRIGLAAALGGVASAFFDRFYALPKDRGAFAIAGVIGAAAGSALVQSLAPPLRRFLPDEVAQYSDFFRPTRARVEVDGRTLPFSAIMSMQVGAIDINLANVVRCFRHAREGGVLHFQALACSPMGMVRNVPNIILGTPIVGEQVFDDRARRVVITAETGEVLGPVIDGEQFTGLERLELSLGPSLRIPTLLAN